MLRQRALPGKSPRALINRARKEELSPDDLSIYNTKIPANAMTAREETVSRAYNALAIPQKDRYTLFKYGKTFNYHGYRTRSYTYTDLEKMFGVLRPTLYAWKRKGILRPPAVIIKTHLYSQPIWFYHQIQPLYVFYRHERHRSSGRRHIRFSTEGLRELHKRLLIQETVYLKQSGQPSRLETKRDKYLAQCGRYGVIWITVDK